MNGTNRLAIGLIGFLAVGSIEPATAAAAANAGGSDPGSSNTVLEEIVVTATKREERLQDVPVSISAITSEEILARGFNQFSDYINSIPGVYFQDGGVGNSVIHIRGATESGVGSTVATYFGEAITSVLTNHGGKPNLRLVDIDRVEVLRGPQGTLFGADALAGVMRIIPAAPDLTKFTVDTGARGFTTAHSDNGSYHVEGVVNMPLVNDKLALRVVAYKDDIAGYIDNVVPDIAPVDFGAAFGLPEGIAVTPAYSAFTKKDINREQTWGVRATLRWQPLERLHFDLNFTTQDAKLQSEPFTDPKAGPYEQQRFLDAYAAGGYGEKVTMGTLTGSYDWDKVSLVSVTNEMQMKRFTDQDIHFLLGAPVPWSLNDTSYGNVFTQEVRLQSRGEQQLQWTVGLFYLHQIANLSQFVPDYSCPACVEALFDQDFAFSVPYTKFSDEKQRSVYGEISYEVVPHLTLGAGGRYLTEDIESISPGASGLLNGGATTDPTPPVTGKIHQFNPSGYVRFKPTEDLTTYFQVSRGFRSGSVNEPYPSNCQAEATSAGITAITDPDTLTNYELGLKSLFADRKISVNAAIYKDKWHGVQLGVALACGFSGIVNAGDIDGKGAELEILVQPTPQWRFNLSAAYTQNHFTDVKDGTGFVSGQRLPDSPEKNGSVGAQYNFAIGAGWSAFARGDFVYVGDVLSQYGTAIVKLGGYGQTNARVGFTHNTLELDVYGDNLTDRRGLSFVGNPAFNPGFGPYQTLIRPREVGAEVRYSFR